MKARFIFLVLAIILSCFRAGAYNDSISISGKDTTYIIHCKKDSCNNIEAVSPSDVISALTLTVNEVNNVLTNSDRQINEILDSSNNQLTNVEIIVACLGVIVTIVTVIFTFLFSMNFNKLRDDVNKAQKEVDGKINKWSIQFYGMEKDYNEAKPFFQSIKTIDNSLSLNKQYMLRINEWMFANTSAIAGTNGKSTDESKRLMRRSYINFYLIKLFLIDKESEVDCCINFIKEQGGNEEIEHLQFIADNDLNEHKKDAAKEAIGYIRARLSQS